MDGGDRVVRYEVMGWTAVVCISIRKKKAVLPWLTVSSKGSTASLNNIYT